MSNLGNVRSLNYNHTGKIKLLKPRIMKYNRPYVELHNGKIRKMISIGRLVAEAFINNKNNYNMILHIDGNPLNNNINNVKWCTPKESRELIISKIDRKIFYNGKFFKTEVELAKFYNINPDNYRKRKWRKWTLEEILHIKVDKKNFGGKPKYYNYYGKLMNLKEISEITGIPLSVIYKRKGYGWDLYECVEIPLSKVRRRNES